jgi:hypothetical protein
MFRILLITVSAGTLAATAATAQAPYAGMQARPIRGLSDRQIADLKAGRGMGMALPAELNGYPGPSHLLELADRLGLSDAQRESVKGLFDAMKAEAIPLGERLIAQEAALDRLFADRNVTPESLAAATTAIGETTASLRNAHLKYHLATVALLRPEQIQRYATLRGYDGEKQNQHHRH